MPFHFEPFQNQIILEQKNYSVIALKTRKTLSNSIMRKAGDPVYRDNAHGAQGIAAELVLTKLQLAVTARAVFKYARGRLADIRQQAYNVAVHAEQNASKTAAGKAPAGGEYRNGLADITLQDFFEFFVHEFYLH